MFGNRRKPMQIPRWWSCWNRLPTSLGCRGSSKPSLAYVSSAIVVNADADVANVSRWWPMLTKEFDVSSSLICFFGSYLSKAVLPPHFCFIFPTFSGLAMLELADELTEFITIFISAHAIQWTSLHRHRVTQRASPSLANFKFLSTEYSRLRKKYFFLTILSFSLKLET